MSQKHFANPALGILGAPDPLVIWKKAIADLSVYVDVLSGNSKIVCPTIGQGTELQALQDISGNWDKLKQQVKAMDLFCCFTNKIRREFQVETIWQDFLKLGYRGEKGMSVFDDAVWLMNPPYNDGSKANNPVYQHFIDKVAKFKPKGAVIIVQANWLMRDNKISQKIRADLKKIGLRKMVLNPVDAFPGASVRTVSLICERGYDDVIEFQDGATGKSITLHSLYGLIPFCFDEEKLELLKKLRPLANNAIKFPAGPKKGNEWQEHFVATAYQNFDIAGDPFGHIRILPPNTGKEFDETRAASGYRIMQTCNSKEEADQALKNMRSYWHSKLVTFIMKYRRTSYTLDNLQISWVPPVDFSKEYTDKDLYKLFNLTDREIELIESEF